MSETSSAEKSSSTEKGRIRWTTEEVQKVAEEAVRVALKDKFLVWIHYAKAQEVLSPERRRKITGKNAITPEMLRIFEETRERVLNQKEKEEVLVEVRVPTLVDRAELLASITDPEFFGLMMERIRQIAPVLAGLQTFATSFQTLARHRIPEMEVPEPIPKVEAPPPIPAPVVTPPRTPPVTKTPALKKTVVVMFGFDEQESEIRKKASHLVNLEMVFLSQPEGKPVPTIPMCTWSIVNRANPLSQRALAALKKRPGKKFTLELSAQSVILQKLHDFNSRQKRQALC